MKAITKQVVVYSCEAIVKDKASLTTLIEQLHEELDNMTECGHEVIFNEEVVDEEETIDTYTYMFDDYAIGSLVIHYDSSKPRYKRILVYFTMTITDDLDDSEYLEHTQDTFNPIFALAECN